MSSEPIVQWNYIIYFHIRGSFLNNFQHQFLAKNSFIEKAVNLKSLFLLTVGYVDMTTYPLTKYYYNIERVYLIYRFFIFFISTFSFLLFLYTVSCRYERDYLYVSVDILFLHYVLNYLHDEDSFIPLSLQILIKHQCNFQLLLVTSETYFLKSLCCYVQMLTYLKF